MSTVLYRCKVEHLLPRAYLKVYRYQALFRTKPREQSSQLRGALGRCVSLKSMPYQSARASSRCLETGSRGSRMYSTWKPETVGCLAEDCQLVANRKSQPNLLDGRQCLCRARKQVHYQPPLVVQVVTRLSEVLKRQRRSCSVFCVPRASSLPFPRACVYSLL